MNWLRFFWVGASVINTAGLARAKSAETETRYRTINVAGLEIFYREAGSKEAPALVLLHGFPSSSHMYRELIPKTRNPVLSNCSRLSRFWEQRVSGSGGIRVHVR
jgi:hypothetical protein